MIVSDAIDLLLERVRGAKNTYASYQGTLEPFGKCFGERNCSDISSSDIRDYLSSLSVSEGSKGLKFRHIKAMFNEGLKDFNRRGETAKWGNPCLNLKAEFKEPRRDRASLSTINTETVKGMGDSFRENHRLIFELGIKGGLAVSEIIALTPTSLTLSNDSPAVVISNSEHGLHINIRYIPKDLYQDISNYIIKHAIKEDAPIFPVTRQGIWWVFKRRGITPRELRRFHTIAATSQTSLYVEPVIDCVKHSNDEITVNYR